MGESFLAKRNRGDQVTPRMMRRSVAAALLAYAIGTAAASAMSKVKVFGDLDQDPYYCGVFAESVLAGFKPSRQQELQWRNLRQEHDALAGRQCQAIVWRGAPLGGEIAGAGPGPRTVRGAAIPADGKGKAALDRFRQQLLAFSARLSDTQRAALDRAIRTRRKALSALQEKLMLHNLML